MVAGSLLSTAVSSGMLGGKKDGQQNAPAAQAEVKAPATPQQPSVGAFSNANANSAAGGLSSTMLAGAGGVPNSLLNLTPKNTLLGA